jgi:HD-GYP domain-containing protein (c-di-GMP phosphodiesterase class II)/Flp pilus assembly pilin Flp
MGTDIRRLLKRETQLNVIAYTLIVALIAAVGVLVFVIMAGIQLPQFWLLNDQIFRTLAAGLLLMVILYLVDQHNRLRHQLVEAHSELEVARESIADSYERLAFSHRAAEIMTSLAQDDGLREVLAESLDHFAVEAAAVVGEDITITTAEGVDSSEAQSAVLDAALETVRAGKPMSVSVGEGGSIAIAVPLRIRGQLKSVVALWRRDTAFTDDELEGLALVARIIELGMENRLLLAEVREQLSGTLRAMVDLVEHRRPNYIPHSTRVAEYATMVGKSLGMPEDETAELRLAAMLQDIGMLEVPEAILNAPRALTAEELMEMRKHVQNGANLAKIANFGGIVQDGVLYHHERLDGSGYPRALKGDAIPLVARILAVCDSYVAMTSERPHRPKMSAIAALNELRVGAGSIYDMRVVREFIRTQAKALSDEHPAVVVTPAGTVEIHTPEELAARPA